MPDNLASRKMLTYKELLAIPSGTSTEQLVDVRTYDGGIVARYNQHDMYHYTGEAILVRDTVARRLAAANAMLGNKRLKVVYGYRHPAVQRAYFHEEKANVQAAHPDWDEEEVKAFTHNLVAVPTVGGHPTGGAVDLTIVDAGGWELDMGTRISDFTDPYKIRTFSDAITPEQAANRLMLHKVMVAQGFMPFYGEWWHFSYGDREWAAFYNKKMALYGTIEI